jgi:toxin ParE1/3/4
MDLESIYGNIDAGNSHAAAQWFNGLEDAIFSLDRLPDRGVRTAEDHNLRQLLYGNKPHIYRIIYEIDRSRTRVLILHIRHGARNAFQSQDIQPPNT